MNNAAEIILVHISWFTCVFILVEYTKSRIASPSVHVSLALIVTASFPKWLYQFMLLPENRVPIALHLHLCLVLSVKHYNFFFNYSVIVLKISAWFN